MTFSLSLEKCSENGADSCCGEIEKLLENLGFIEQELSLEKSNVLENTLVPCTFGLYIKDNLIVYYSALNIESLSSREEMGINRYNELFGSSAKGYQKCSIDYALIETSDDSLIDLLKEQSSELGWQNTKTNILNLIKEEINCPISKNYYNV